jgi:Fic family protein
MLQRTLYGLAQAGETASSAEAQHLSGLTAANTASGLFRLEKQGIISRVGDKKRNVTYKINDYLLCKWLEKK